MKIGMLCTSLPHRGDPVAGRFVADMAAALAARGHAVRVVAARRRTQGGWCEPVGVQGVEVITVAAPGASLLYDGGAPERLAGPTSALRALGVSASLGLAAAAHLRGCDALVSHFLVPSALLCGALAEGRPHLAICHGSDAAVFARLPARLQRWTLGRSSARWYVHPGLRALVDPEDRDAIVSPMGFVAPPPVSPPPAPPLRVAVVSRLVAVKDPSRAIRAIAIARARGADLRLDVIGDGPLGDEVRALAAPFGDAVRIHGALTPEARDRVLAAAHVLLHCARATTDGRTEGAPTAVLESMAAGRCVVATAAGGVPWLVGDAGLLLPEGATPAEIADALLGLTEAERRRLGDKAIRRVEGWSWDAVAARVERTLAR